MKSFVALIGTLFVASVAFASTPAAKPATAAAPAAAKVDCKDVKNKDHADCKKK